jgi:hypothetical protein
VPKITAGYLEEILGQWHNNPNPYTHSYPNTHTDSYTYARYYCANNLKFNRNKYNGNDRADYMDYK